MDRATREATDRAVFLAAARRHAPAARAIIMAAPQRGRESFPAQVWAGIDATIRQVVILLASEAAAGDEDTARTLARQPWESFTPADRDAMAAMARMLRGQLVNAGCLW